MNHISDLGGCFQIPGCNQVTMTSVKPISPQHNVVVVKEVDMPNAEQGSKILNEIKKIQHRINITAQPEGIIIYTPYIKLNLV